MDMSLILDSLQGPSIGGGIIVLEFRPCTVDICLSSYFITVIMTVLVVRYAFLGGGYGACKETPFVRVGGVSLSEQSRALFVLLLCALAEQYAVDNGLALRHDSDPSLDPLPHHARGR